MTVDLRRAVLQHLGNGGVRQSDEDTACTHLTIAPIYLRKMHEVVAYCAALPAGGEG